MKRSLNFFLSLSVFLILAALGPLLLSSAFSASAYAVGVDEIIASRTVEIDGVKLHYLTAGRGPALILLHGYTQTSRMWRPLIDKLKDTYTVIAPDLPGIGDSDIP